MKKFKSKLVITMCTLLTMVSITDLSIKKNPAYAKTVDTKALASTQRLMSHVEKLHKKNVDEKAMNEKAEQAVAKKEAEAKAKAEAKAEAIQAAKERKAAAIKKQKALTASYAKTTVKNGTATYKYVKAESGNIEASATYKAVQNAGSYKGAKLSRSAGTTTGPNGKETFYNLNMSRVVSIMHAQGYSGKYWVRSDGVKMLGNYVMLASNNSVRPKGTIYETSLGLGIVCDTGSFASGNPRMTDIAVAW
jgi:hypothetical protein